MKKLLTIFGLVIATQSAFAINPDSPMGKTWVREANFACVKEMVIEDIWAVEFATKYCDCTLRKFVSEMSVKELQLYGDDDPKMEAKANKMIEKFGEECLEALSK